MENTHENTAQNSGNIFSEIVFPHPHMPQVRADVLGEVSHWPISNSTSFLWFITILFLLFAYAIKRFTLVPGFFQSSVELFLETIEGLMKSFTNDRAHRIKELLFPISAIFLIVGAINILGSLPIITEFTWGEEGHLVPLFRKSTSDINVTFPLALTIVLSMQYFGVKNWGFFGYIKRFFPIDKLIHESKKGFGGFLIGLIEIFIGFIELVSEFIKVISLSLRLFGNMFAGEIVFVIITSAFALAIPALWIGFDLMVAVIQTLVIGALTTVYYIMVIKEPGEQSH